MNTLRICRQILSLMQNQETRHSMVERLYNIIYHLIRLNVQHCTIIRIKQEY
jgi:hypothetical protein